MPAVPPPVMFEPDAESMPAQQRAGVQQDRLRALIGTLLAAGGLQAGRLKEAGVGAGGDVRLDDLAALPTTSKQDLWDAYPFGLLAVPRREVVAVHGSSGTGGRPTLVSYTRADLRLWARMCARALAAAGAGPGSIVHNAYGYGLFTGGLGIHQGAIELGATVVPVSGGMTPRQVTLIADLQPDILTCTPSYAIRLGPGSRTCSGCGRWTYTGCRRSSAPAWRRSAWSPQTGCTSTRITSWSRRSIR
jgi:phenylacetate-coenzyme A ligase PaaK-like adenylate-forming protein